jgi:hypothetical protein
VITEFSIGNFKAFAATQRVPIKPLTLIFGANGSGKSSLLHGLLMFHHAASQSGLDMHRLRHCGDYSYSLQPPDIDVYQPKLAGNLIDLGGFSSFVHKHRINQYVEIGVKFDLKNRFLSEQMRQSEVDEHDEPQFHQFEAGCITQFLEKQHSLGVQLSIGYEPPRQSFPCPHMKNKRDQDWVLVEKPVSDRLTPGTLCVQKCEIMLDHTWLLRLERSSDSAMDIVGANWDHKSAEECLGGKEWWSFSGNHQAMSFYEVVTSFLPEWIKAKPSGPRWAFMAAGESSGKFPQSLIRVLRGAAGGACKSMNYLGGIRVLPPRQLASTDRYDSNWTSAGMDTWHNLVHNGDLLDVVNEWLSSTSKLGTHYQLAVRTFMEMNEAAKKSQRRPHKGEARLQEAVKSSGQLEAATALRELAIVDKGTGVAVSHRDVGLGISQILPVLVNALGSEQQVHLMEQPEMHLHPALQAQLGDVFVESALGPRKNTFILETHSEHLILRVMRRIRETAQGRLPPDAVSVRPNDVAVLYVERDGDHSIVRDMPLNEQGELVKAWPGGFFEEGYRELFS